jgi:hypothetical protein
LEDDELSFGEETRLPTALSGCVYPTVPTMARRKATTAEKAEIDILLEKVDEFSSSSLFSRGVVST